MTAKSIPGVQTVGDILAELDARPKLGDNMPPPTPFEAARDAINDLSGEAKNWLDGAPIETQAQADEVGKLVDGFRKAHKAADDARKVENEPFDTGKAEVQGRYNPILKIAKDGEAMAKIALAKFMAAQEELRLQRQREAQRIADQQAADARQAIADANASANLSAREDAEKLVEEAAETAKLAAQLDREKPMVATGGGRRISMRSVWSATITDRLLLMRALWKLDASAFDETLLRLANERAKGGMRELDGAKITETKYAV